MAANDFDWFDVWIGVAAFLALAWSGLGMFAITKEHKVDGYYLSHSGNAATSTCVYAHWTWHPDELAFCSDDKNTALDFAAKANALVR